MIILSKDTRIAYRNYLRDARAKALSDAEGFQDVLFTIENLGNALFGKAGNLGFYKDSLLNLAKKSPLAFDMSTKFRYLHTPFDVLYAIVRVARNDALHQGAYARHITAHTVELSIALEDALSNDFATVSDFMVKTIISAELWQPLAFLRQQMLTNSFSYLPLFNAGQWNLISDHSLAVLLRRPGGNRNAVLGMTLGEAIQNGAIIPDQVKLVAPDKEIQDALGLMNGYPVLVHHSICRDEIIGILTAFDLM